MDTTPQPLTFNKSNLSEMLVDFSIDRVMAIDLEWNIISWNKASEIASGLSKKDVLGKNLLNVFASLKEDKEIMHAIHGAFLGNKTFVFSDKAKLHRYYYENHFIPLKDGRKIIGVMNIMHDVAHRVQTETQLRELNANLADKFAQLEKLSGEIRNFTTVTTDNIRGPLKFIYTSLELLIKAETRNLSDSSKANLRRMQVSLNRINRLVEDITDLFAISSNSDELVPVHLSEVLAEVQKKLARKITEHNVSIETSKLPVVSGLPAMIESLFANILDNAIKFGHDDRSPVIRINHEMSFINQQTRQPDPGGHKMYKITIADNGIGIPADQIENIFTMFTQLNDKKRYPGSGLGLSFSRKIMDTLGGFIQAQSEPGKGTSIICYFQVVKD